jgi:bacillithiol biosynthesis deacetylase BshB1
MVDNIGHVDMLAFGAHPDDIELGCSGTLLEHIKLGYSVGLCDFTHGELGTRGSGPLRLVEAENARIHMGANWRLNLGIPDGFFTHDKETLLKVIKVIRQATPKIILINTPEDRHPDHGRASKIVREAAFYSGLSKVSVKDDNGNEIPKWRPTTVLQYIQDKEITPDLVFDITNSIDLKIECIQKFSSQFYIGNEVGEQTPISSKQFFEFVKSKNRVYGRDIQVDFAEAFIMVRKHSVADLFLLK